MWNIVHGHSLISTHRFIPRAETINVQASCVYCSWLWSVLFIAQEAWRIRSSKRCAVQSKRLFPFSSTFYFFFQLPMAKCFQSPSMLCPNPLQCLSPTHQPQSYQNRAHHLMKANPLCKTKRKDPLCSTKARAHLLSAWDILATTVGLCIHG